MDSSAISAVQQRILEIETRLAPLRPQPVSGGAFASALAAATTGVTGANQVGHAHATAPPELAKYGNGRIPTAALSPIGRGSHRLWAPAATSFQRLAQAAAADGVEIGVTDSYRSYEDQVELAERKGLYSQGGLAAQPGTSTHGWGLSLDLDLDDRAQAWMRANGARFGFVEDVPREPWHWTFKPAPATPAESRPLALLPA